MASLCRLATRTASEKRFLTSLRPERARFLATAPAYPGHIPLTWFENAFLLVGAGLMTLADSRRGDLVAVVGETSAGPSLRRLRDIMLESTEGRKILKQRPRINTSTLDMNKLAQLPEGTFGRAYTTWLERCRVTPDTRAPVHYIDDPELAYVMQRYRECHDFYHCVCNMPVNVESELAIKYFELANLGLPMAGFSAALYPWRLNSTKRHKVFSEYAPWALKCGSSARSLITVFWEERWEQNIKDMQREFGIWDGPPAKWPKPLKGTREKQASTEGAEKSTKTMESSVIPRILYRNGNLAFN